MYTQERIRKVGSYNGGYTYYPVVIVGAGESGIAMGCQLIRKLGFDQFRIFDRQAGLGGTWWINRYPGVAVDIPAAFYSFSFAPNPKWTSFYPKGEEIHAYLTNVCAQYGITDKIELNTDVEECRWLEDEKLWEIKIRHMAMGTGDMSREARNQLMEEKGEQAVYCGTETIRAKLVFSAAGGLVEPNVWPANVPGKEKFQGPIFHTARWDKNVDMNGKDVIVMGTGCSAAQVIPCLTKAPYNAKSVTQLMRSPPWVIPRAQPPGGDEGWSHWAPMAFSYVPGLLKLFRGFVFFMAETEYKLFGNEEYNIKMRKQMEAKLTKHIKKMVPQEYHDMLIPDYSVGCKRRIIDTVKGGWFSTLNDPNVTITTQPLTRIGERSVTIGPSRSYPPPDRDSKAPTDERTIPADVIVMANGFRTEKWLHPLKVVGRTGQDLVTVMEDRGGPQAYQGTAMDGFPNFFIIFGPNTATGHSSVILATENMIMYAMPFVKRVLAGEVETVEVKKEAEVAYTTDIQARLKKMIWTSGGCQNWYVNGKTGWNGTAYP